MSRRGSPGPSRPRPAVPERKISETLLLFAEPLLREADDQTTDEQLRSALTVAILAWNAVAIEDWGVGRDLLAEARASLRQAGVSSGLLDDLVARRRQLFGEDPRAVGAWEIHREPDGGFRLRATAHLPRGDDEPGDSPDGV